MLLNEEIETCRGEDECNKIKIRNARSYKDRIQISSEKHNVTALRENNGEITIISESNSKSNFLKKYADEICIAEFLFFFIMLILNVLHSIQNTNLGRTTLFYSKKYIIFTIFWLIVMILGTIIVRVKGGERLLKNHGAEHMVVEAYNKLGRMPTIDEIKKYSRISCDCGIGKIASLATWNFFGFLLSYFFGIKISLVILYVFACDLWNIVPSYCLGLLFQYFTTGKPDDENIELAMAALSKLIETGE